MAYELTIKLKDGWIEIEADTPAQLQKRVAALDLPRLEASVREARRPKRPRSGARKG